MTVSEVAATGYRSLRSIRFPVHNLSVFIGANGVRKTNLYRALELLQSTAAGTLTRDLASAGGMDSVAWTGRRMQGRPVRVRLAVELADAQRAPAYGCTVEVGLVPQFDGTAMGAAFLIEPQVKAETLVDLSARRPVTILDRDGPTGFVRDEEGRKRALGTHLPATETALGVLQDAVLFPELHLIRRALLGWRSDHDFRTDSVSALRRPCLAVTTLTLASDGSDLAAVFATLAPIRQDTAYLAARVHDAFSGARLVIPPPDRLASFGLIFPVHPKRVVEPSKLSDGTLRYLAPVGPLSGYRLPAFLARNEPETSLHPDLKEPLARMIARASERTQNWPVTHSERLADAIADVTGVVPRTIVKRKGETWIDGLKPSEDVSDEPD